MEVTLDLEEVKKSIERGLVALGDAIVAAVPGALEAGVSAARAAATFKDRSTNARGAIGSQINRTIASGTNREVRAQLHCLVPYASFLERGTDPHEIRARRRSSLRWVGDDGIVFARVVQHPGTKAIGFMAKGATAFESAMTNAVDSATPRFDEATK